MRGPAASTSVGDGRQLAGQFQNFAVLGETPEGRQWMTDVADWLVHSRSGLTYQVGQPAEAGRGTKTPSPDDERSVVVGLTPAGSDLLGRVMTGYVQVVQRLLLAPLSVQDVADLGEVLERAARHMRTIPPRSAAPRRKRV